MDVNRSSENINMDEIDSAMLNAYSVVVNGLSQVYTLSKSQQELAFRAGERHSLEKVRQWMLERWGEGYRPTIAEIDAYIQHELSSEGGVASTRITTQHQQTTIGTCPSMASPNMPVRSGAEQNNNPMIPTAPPGSLRGEQKTSLIRYYHGRGSGSHSASNEQIIGPHITQPNNSETQIQDQATDQNAYDPRFNWACRKTG